MAVADALIEDGLLATMDHLGEDTTDTNHAILVKEAYLLLLERLAAAGLTPHAEVSVKLSAIGQSLSSDGEKIALEHAHAVCEAAQRAGTTVTFDMEDHTTTDSTLKIVSELRRDYPWAGIVLQAYLRRTEADCKDFAVPGSRVRLCKGAYREPESVAYKETQDVDLSYVRCMRTLMAGEGYPMLATHDPRLIEIGGALAVRNGRGSAATSSRCCSGSGRTSRSGWPPPGSACGCMCRMGASGTATSCDDWPSARRTSASSRGR